MSEPSAKPKLKEENLSYLAVKTCYDYEQKVAYLKIQAEKLKGDRITEEMTQITCLLQRAIAEKQKTSQNGKEGYFNMQDNPIDKNLYDQVREMTIIDVHGQPTTFMPHGEYVFKEHSLDALISGLESQLKIRTHQLSPTFMNMQNEIDTKNRIDGIASSTTDRQSRGISHIINNTAKSS